MRNHSAISRGSVGRRMDDAIQRVLWRYRRRASAVRRAPPEKSYAVVTHDGKDRAFVKACGTRAGLAYARGMAVHEAGQRSAVFRAPKPLELLEAEGIVVWEYLDRLTECREFLVRDLQARPMNPAVRCLLFRRLGQALQGIHEALVISETVTESAPIREIRSPFPALNQHAMGHMESSPRSPLHWDFSFGNCFVSGPDSGNPEIVIIDPEPNSYLVPEHGVDTVGSVYVDAAQLVFSMWCHPRYSGWVAGEGDAYLDAFVSGYGDGGTHMDKATILACAAEIALIYQEFSEARRKCSAVGERCDRWLRMESVRRMRAAAHELIVRGA